MAIELPDGKIVTGRSQHLMNAASSAIINATKALAGIADEVHLMSPVILEPILKMKREMLRRRDPDAQFGRSADCAFHLRGNKSDGRTGAFQTGAFEKL